MKILGTWTRAVIIVFFALTSTLPALSRAASEVEARVDSLLARMTLEEKIGQLHLAANGKEFRAEDVRAGRVGAVINFNNPQDIARVQEAAAQSRLGIPLLISLDVLHGFRTSFPLPLAEAASFNPRLARLSSYWAARESRHIGLNWTLAPMVDLARDPRWGRIIEGSGEDVHLGTVMAAARVEGLREGGLIAGPKHFAGYGAAAGGRDYDRTDVPRADLRDNYLPPFRAAIGAGAETVMSAFNALNGVPATANRWLLTDVLRGEWGFDGLVVSDWDSIGELVRHGVAADDAEAARKAFLAGVDMDLAGGHFAKYLAGEVEAGRVPMARVDEAVRRVLRVKIRAGLFDHPVVDRTRTDAIFPTPESRAAALEVARESIVLLHNRDAFLPLKPEIRKLAVIGPLAASAIDQIGPHQARGHWQDTISIFEGLRRRGETSGVLVSHAEGCDRTCTSDAGFDFAVETARNADAVIAVVGEHADMSGEAASRARITLEGRQAALLERLFTTGKPVIIVLVAGRPLEITPFVERSAGILTAWYLGNEAGTAFAEILFGDTNPSGRLPVTWPRSSAQVPIVYNPLPSGRPAIPGNRFTLGYRDEPSAPLYPFGFGLSYTRFTHGAPTVAKPRITAAEDLVVSAPVTNAGNRAGQEVVQLYIRDPVASRSRPVRELKAFEKIALAPGETRIVTLRVPGHALGFHDEDGTYTVEPGRFEIFVGADSRAPRVAEIEITEGLVRKP